MKIATRAHSKVTHQNGAHGRAFARNGTGTASKGIIPMAARVEPLKGAERLLNGKNAGNENGALSSGQSTLGLNEVRRREFLPIAVGRSESASGLPGRAVSENEIIFLYCIKGRGWCEVEGKRYEIMSGQLVVMPASIERTYAACGERSWSLIWIQLAEITMEAFVSKLSLKPQAPTLGQGEKTDVLALFQEVLQALEMPSQERLLQVSRRAMHLLDGAISSQRQILQIETDAAGRVGRTIEYMKEHLNEPLRAATLAAVAKMSLPHYFAQFKRVVGGSPIDYLIKLRMEHARRLLAETSWSVKEVAVSLGYDDPLYFSRVFKSINQSAPSDFRAGKRNPNGG
jgi:AraC-like DNA-binding protein